MTELHDSIMTVLRDVLIFADRGNALQLRQYQVEVAQAVVDSVVNQRGLTFVVIFPRQSGKNELQAQLESYLLAIYSSLDAEMVKVSPTWKPQSLNAMRRLERVLKRSLVVREKWSKEQGYIYRIESARIFFLSGSPTSNIVGATANILLECDEAQDILISKWDKDIAPMAASTNATRIFWGTAWTSRTLLAREKRAAEEAQAKDGIRRVFVLDADDVAAEVPAYGEFVAGEVRKHGRNHPFVKTQYFSEEIDAEGGMFPPARLALMRGEHCRRQCPMAGAKDQRGGKLYALLVDVAGEDEGISDFEFGNSELANPTRDATALTVVEVDLSTLADELIKAPTYRVVDRKQWIGVKHSSLYGKILALYELWRASYLVIDATGVGAGLASFLEKSLKEQVIRFEFNSSTKSRLGWDFLSVIESGRFKDWSSGDEEHVSTGPGFEQAEFYQQLQMCQMEISEGPERRMKWGVPDGTRDPTTGELVHDDWILSAALCAVLDSQVWGLAESQVIPGMDPIEGLHEVF